LLSTSDEQCSDNAGYKDFIPTAMHMQQIHSLAYNANDKQAVPASHHKHQHITINDWQAVASL
jgi:hypothetical protein